jgi:bacterioferritin
MAKAEMKTLVKALQGDLKYEYSALLQYLQHSYLMSGMARKAVAPELVIHAQQEYGHALILGAEIVRLGGTPRIEVLIEPLVTDNVSMLEQDLAGENKAIADYKARIKMADELGEYGLTSKLSTILEQEEEHQQDLVMILKDMRRA